SLQAVEQMEAAFGLHPHTSIFQQYFEYLSNTAHGDLGTSLSFFPTPVGKVVMLALPWSVGLVGTATVIAFVLGTLIGMLAAWRRGGLFDAVLPPVFIVISAFPYFWLGLIFLLVFALTLNWFPLGFGYELTSTINLSWSFVGEVVWHAFLPAL